MPEAKYRVSVGKDPSVLFYAGALLAVLFGLYERLLLVLAAGSFSFDEIISVAVAQKPLAASWAYLQYENTPPLYYWLLHVWGQMFGFSEVPSRILSFIFGGLTIPIIYWLGRELFNWRAGWIAAAVFSTAATAITIGGEARMYGLLFFLSALSIGLYWKIRQSPGEAKLSLLGLYSLTLLLALYTHLTAVALVATFTVWLLISGEWRGATRIFLATGIAVLGYLPWVIVIAREKIVLWQEGFLNQAWYFKSGAGPEILRLLFEGYMPLPSIYALSVIYVPLIALLVFLAIVRISRLSGGASPFSRLIFRLTIADRATALGVLGFCLAPLVASLSFNTHYSKYYLSSLIFLYLLLAKGIEQAGEHLPRPASIPAAILAGGLVLYSAFLIDMRTHWPGWREAAQFVRQSQAEILLVDPVSIVIDHYRTLTSPPVFLLTSDRFPWASGGQHLDALQYAIRYNYTYPYTPPSTDEFVQLDSRLSESKLGSLTRLAYAYYYFDHRSAFILKILQELGYRCQAARKYFVDYATVAIMTKDNHAPAASGCSWLAGSSKE